MRDLALLAGALAAVAWFLRGDIPGMPRRHARTRIAMFRRALVKDALGLLLPALAGLALMGRLRAIGRAPPELSPLRPWLSVFDVGPWPLIGGVVLGTALAYALARRRRRMFTLGDVDAVLSHSREEVPYGLALAVMAGVAEELFFRLWLPLLLTLVTGGAVVGGGVALALFAAMHRYQGWKGVLGTGLLGAFLQALYLAEGSLWPAMLVHAVVNMNGTVLRPAMLRWMSARAAG